MLALMKNERIVYFLAFTILLSINSCQMGQKKRQAERKKQKTVNKGGFKSLGKTAWYDSYIPKAQVTRVMFKKSTMTTPEKRCAELQASLDSNFDAKVRASNAEFWPSIPMRS